MIEVSVRQARERLSELLDAAERGEVVRIVRNGKPVADLSKPYVGFDSKRLAELRKLRESIKVKGEPLSKTVVRMRREARH